MVPAAHADETCSSPYLARIEGQEEFIYVWTLGVEGLGDGSDKLVVVDVKPGSPSCGKVIHNYSVGGRHEAHHGGFTDDRRQLWLAGLDTSKIFVFDVHSEPARPRYVKTIDNIEKVTGGAVGPHGVYALPGRVLIPCLSNAKDKGGRTALVEYSNDGDYIATHRLPTKETAGVVGADFDERTSSHRWPRTPTPSRRTQSFQGRETPRAWRRAFAGSLQGSGPSRTTSARRRDAGESTASVGLTGRVRPHRRDHGGKVVREQRRVGPIELHTG